METKLISAQEKLELNMETASAKMEERINSALQEGIKQLQEKSSGEQKDTRILLTSQLTAVTQSLPSTIVADVQRNVKEHLQTQMKEFVQQMELRDKAKEESLKAIEAKEKTLIKEKTQSSIKLGQEGEDEVLEYLYSHFARFNIESTGHTSQSNDIILSSEKESMVISIEVKNKKNITKEDLMKFERDNGKIKSRHSNYKHFVFLFISLGCHIPDKDTVDFSFDDDHVCTAYLAGRGIIESEFLSLFVQFVNKSREDLEANAAREKDGSEILVAR